MPDQGSSHRRAYFATPAGAVPPLAAEGDANPDTQATIITRAPPLAQYPLAGLHPRDLGKLLEGQRLGHFDLHEYVGGGGMGAVFKALDTMLNRVVAVKVLSQEQSSDEETLRRFQNEAQSAARLDHENISRVFYVGEDRGWHYIVFEFIEGANLRDVVQNEGPLTLARAVSYTLQIADALTHASQRDVVHRDIKPSNVLITPDGRAKLVDMGLARLHQVEPVANDLTASGVTLGTFDYISPEQARDPRSADVRSDIYSLGCTLYFMLTGRPPFPDGTVLQKLLQHQGDQPRDPRTFRPELPEDLMKIMDRMLAKQPERRYSTPEELIAELTALAAKYGLEGASSSRLVWPSTVELQYTFWERHLPWIAPLAALFLLVAILGFIWSRDDGLDVPPPIVPASNVPQPAADDGAANASDVSPAAKGTDGPTEADQAQAQAHEQPDGARAGQPGSASQQSR